MKLSELKETEQAVIVKVRGRGAFRKRITEMGFVKGQRVTVIKNAPLRDPVEYTVMGYQVSLRRSEAELIEVLSESESLNIEIAPFSGTLESKVFKKSVKEKHKKIHVALVGNPNCGKTTLFNHASGSEEHTGNYSGVTVDAKEAHFRQNGYTFQITDLPGTYSLTAYSPEELYVRKYIFEEIPDIVINVVDASNLERNLYLTALLIDMDIKVVMSLNMFDELEKSGDRLDFVSLGKLIGIPIIPTSAKIGKGISELFDKVIEVYEDRDPVVRHIHINFGKDIETAVKMIQDKIKTKQNIDVTIKYATRFLALNLLENDPETLKLIRTLKNAEEIEKAAEAAKKMLFAGAHEEAESLITDARYGFINGAILETMEPGTQRKHKITESIDALLTNKIFGFPIFIFFMWLMFQSTFSLGKYPMMLIDSGVTAVSRLIHNNMIDGMLKDLIGDGIINGVGGVIVFLPNILILFFFISLMEDTGYMARAAFIMDKLMHKIGLHGKSFIPLIMGFGCNVPAIMSTRTIENRNDRLLTMLINPFMSCSARLPVYIVIIGAVFPHNSGTILFALYSFGIITAIVVAKVFKKFIFKSKETPFVMELPPYRMPVAKTTLKHMWRKASQYIQKMGGIILVASILIWTLGYFPRTTKNSESFQNQISEINSGYRQKIRSLKTGDEISKLKSEQITKSSEILRKSEADRQENSFIGKIGKGIEPVLRPLGFDWKIGVSIVSGIAAKEIIVSTMSVLYGADNNAVTGKESLSELIRNEKYVSGKKAGRSVFTTISAISFLLFILLYFPCVATIAAIKKESGSWKWAIFTVIYTTGLAWTVSFAVFQIGSFFNG
jgi:ferrous iron transport protein B